MGRMVAAASGFVGTAHPATLSADAHTINVANTADLVMESNITLGSVVTCAGNQMWSLKIERRTGDSFDTADSNGTWQLLGVMVLFSGQPSTQQDDDPQYPRRGISSTE